MKIVLATGIYPPQIGGPATYCRALACELKMLGANVSVLTYARKSQDPNSKFQKNSKSQFPIPNSDFDVIRISNSIPVIRWFAYARALRRHASDADAVIAFSSVSAGVPLWLSRIKKPKKYLRLGGDFFWERYTALGGMLGLRNWYGSKGGKNPILHSFMQWLLNKFDHIVFSTKFQESIYRNHYSKLPSYSVLENALPSGNPQKHEKHDPFKILFMGRFVGFKNLPTLVQAVNEMTGVTLTLVGDGPMRSQLEKVAGENVSFHPSVHGEEKQRIFAEHDLMVIPSITEISPNVALEARANGLPVLLTKETGLSEELTNGMIVRNLSSAEKIAEVIQSVIERYSEVSAEAASNPSERGWGAVADEWISLLSSSR